MIAVVGLALKVRAGGGEERHPKQRGGLQGGTPSVWGLAELAGKELRKAGRTPVAQDHKGCAEGLEGQRESDETGGCT